MATQQNQAPAATTLYEPGVCRRLSRIVDRGDQNHLVPGTGIAMDEFHQYQLLGRQLQARAVASAFSGLFKTLGSQREKLAAAFKRPARFLDKPVSR